jgi:hypothetical protein
VIRSDNSCSEQLSEICGTSPCFAVHFPEQIGEHESLQIRTAFILRHDCPNVVGCGGSFHLCIGNRPSPYGHHRLHVPAARLHSSIPDSDNNCARFWIAFEHPNWRPERRTVGVGYSRSMDVCWDCDLEANRQCIQCFRLAVVFQRQLVGFTCIAVSLSLGNRSVHSYGATVYVGCVCARNSYTDDSLCQIWQHQSGCREITNDKSRFHSHRRVGDSERRNFRDLC